MRSGISSFAFTWGVGVGSDVPEVPLGPLDLVEEAAALGMEVLQLADNVPLAGCDAAALRELRRRSAAANVRLELGARGLTPGGLDRHLALASTLDAGILRYVIDAPGHEPAAEVVVALLRARRDALETSDVTLALENHDRFKAAELARVVREVDSPRVGVCLDTANSIGAGEGLHEVLAELAPMAVNLHVKDFTIRRRRHGMGFVVEGARLGDGALDLPAVLDAVERFGRCGTAVFEQWAPERPTPKETVALERAWAREGTAVLRQALAARQSRRTTTGAHATT